MSLLEFRRVGWFFSRDNYKIVQEGTPIGEIYPPLGAGRGAIKIGSTSYILWDDVLGACFLDEENGRRLITVDPPTGIQRRQFTLRIGGKAYNFKAPSIFGSAFVLIENGRELGSIVLRAFSWRGAADLPESLPLEARAFMIWLAIRYLYQRPDGDG
jgi:hypothetical protein